MGFATLVRSVAFDRWITVLASLLLVVGATAALGGRTWWTLATRAAPGAWAPGARPGGRRDGMVSVARDLRLVVRPAPARVPYERLTVLADGER